MLKIASKLQYIRPICLTRASNNVMFTSYLTVSKRLFRLFYQNIEMFNYEHAKDDGSVSHYEVLDVPRSASQEEIKKVFFEKSKKFHPDVSPDNPDHHKIFVQLNNAYSVLGDKSKRKDYDQSLKPKIYTHKSNENLHHWYQENSFYYARDPGVKYSASDRPKNYKVALAIILLMSTGVAVRIIWIWYEHSLYKKRLDLNSLKASKSYQESRERSSKYTMKEQMKILAEKQGKIERKRS